VLECVSLSIFVAIGVASCTDVCVCVCDDLSIQ